MIRRGEVSDMQSLSLALQGTIGTGVLCFFSLVNLHGFGLLLTAIFLPLAGLYLWPYRAHFGWSLFGVWLCGLLQDVLTGGTIGLFGLLYVMIFTLTNPTERQFAPGLLRHMIFFMLLLLPVMLLVWLLSAVALGQFASLLRIGVEALWTLALFPLVYAARQFIRHIYTDEDEAGLYL